MIMLTQNEVLWTRDSNDPRVLFTFFAVQTSPPYLPLDFDPLLPFHPNSDTTPIQSNRAQSPPPLLPQYGYLQSSSGRRSVKKVIVASSATTSLSCMALSSHLLLLLVYSAPSQSVHSSMLILAA